MDIKRKYEDAILSEASYANLQNKYDSEDVKIALIANGFSPTQATDLVSNWRVVDHQPDTSSGFSATLFEQLDDDGKGTGEYTFAIRGTQGLVDIEEDIFSLSAQGIAREQAVDLYRYYKRLTTPDGQSVNYSTSEMLMLTALESGSFSPLTTTVAYISIVAQISSDTGLGKLDEDTKIDLTGHSLGGHMAMLFTQMFPEAVDHVYTYNGAGLGGIGAELLDLTGFSGTVPSSQVTNIVADQGIDFTAGVGYVIGDTERIYIEEGSSIHNHSIATTVDSLAVYNLFEAVDSTTDITSLTSILEAASIQSENSLEATVQDFAELLAVPVTLRQDDREQLHQSLQAIDTELYIDRTASNPILKPQYQNLKIVDLSGHTIQGLVNGAKNNIAFRYALTHLNPFAVTGSDALYTPRNQNNELELYNETTREGTLTQSYLKDRARFLTLLIERNLTDASVAGDAIEFFDKTSGVIAQYDNPHGGDRSRYHFGGDGIDLLQGGDKSDHLYGGGDSDILIGNAGADHLEGGEGDDTYITGDGDTIYDTDGFGRVMFGENVLYGGEKTPEDDHYQSFDGDFTYRLAAQTLTVTGADGVITIENFMDGDLGIFLDATVADAETIDLPGKGDDISIIDPAGVVIETLAYGIVSDPSTDPGLQVANYQMETVLDDDGNAKQIYVAYDAAGGRHEVYLGETIDRNGAVEQIPVTSTLYDGRLYSNQIIYGTAISDFILADGGAHEPYAAAYPDVPVTQASLTGIGTDTVFGGGGNDSITGNFGDDRLYGESGHDLLKGDIGDDYLNGGAGQDILRGSYGRDILYGGIGDDWLEGDIALVDGLMSYGGYIYNYDQLQTPAGWLYRLENDYLDGGSGNDILIGNAGSDLLNGGSGDDRLYGDDLDPFPDGYDVTFSDTLIGGSGNDSLYGGSGADFLYGDVGDDILDGDSGDLKAQYHDDDALFGGAGVDTLIGNGGNDILYGGDGDDVMDGDSGNLSAEHHGEDKLFGGMGTDTLIGNGGNDLLAGEGDDDLLFGDASDIDVRYHGNDTLNGGDGNDTLVGSGGSDTLYGDEGNDQLYGDSSDIGSEHHGDDILDGGDGDDLLMGSGGSDLLIGGEGNDQLSGDSSSTAAAFQGDDTLYGGGGHDILAGHGGNDTLDGGGGNDRASGGMGDDTISGGAGNDILTGGEGKDNLFGNEGDDRLHGDDGDDNLSGGLGDDLMSGNDGDDLLKGDTGNDVLYGLAGNDYLDGGAGVDYLFGGSGNDLLFGGAGNDILNGETGVDILRGGEGEDIYLYNPGDGELYIEDQSSNILRFGRGIHLNMISLGLGSLKISTGTPGDDIHIAGFDPDNPYQASGITRFEFSDGRVFTHQMLIETVGFDFDGTNGDDSLIGTNASDRLNGFAGNDTLIGKDGEDILDGGSGADAMTGGAGNDRYVVDDLGDRIIEHTGEGHDRVVSSVDIKLSDNIEDLILTGWAVNGVGNTLSNDIWGTKYNNQLDGGVGDDNLYGQSGADILTGGDGWDRLYGDNGSDTLHGGDGADRLHGGSGSDFMVGGAGDDSYWVDDKDDVIVEQADEGHDRVYSTISLVLINQLEELYLDGYEAIDGTGNSQDNRIVGNGVDNVLTGEAGDDILIGSYGYNQLYGGMGKDTLDGRKGHSELYGGMDNDHYIIDSDTDIIIEALASGYDTVESSVSYILADNLESLQLTGSSAISGSGNSSDNNLLGNDAENQLSGQAGDDTIDGAAGNDWLEGNGGDDILYGGDDAFRRIEPPCIDMYWSGISGVSAKGHGLCEIPIIYKALPNNDYLDGGAGDDQLDGGTGDDELFGGAGQDELTGGTGNDLLDGGESLDIMAGGKGDDAYYVDGYAETILIPVEDDDEPVDVETRYCACDAISIGADENGKGNEGVGNGEDPPPPGHDDNWNDGVDTSPGNPGSKGGVNSKDNKDNDQYKQTDTESQAVSEASQNSPYTGNVTDTSEVSDPATYARQPKYIEETIYHTDTVIEQDGGGYDVVYASTTYALTDHVEELHLTGTQALDGTGNASNNRLYGNSADNVLDGGLGDDILQGGLGNDTYVIDSLYDVINETYDSGEDTVISSISYQLSDELEHLTLSGTQAINARGNQGDNSLTGNEADNTIAGGLGNDTLNGGQGNDLLDGGEGDDLYLFELGDGLDTVTDTSGIDRIVFGEGIDFDRVAVRTETVNGVTTAHLRMLDQYGNEQIDQGMDFSLDPQNHTASIESFEFADGSERSLDELLIQSLEHNGSKKQDNLILGRDDDLVWAGRGDDVVSSGTGNDILLGETGEDTLSGQGGIDLLVGGEGEDNLYGGGGNDLLFGGSNEDRLVGCHGNDLYVGGLGNDSLYLQCGDNLVLYNRGDGRDKLHLDEQVSGVTLSLGAGIALADLSLEKAEHDLILHIDGIEENELPSKDFSEGREDNKRGQGDTAIVLDDWYLDDASSESPALTLQIITEAQAAFEVNSTDPLLNQRIHQYDLAAVIQAFDEARVLGDQQDPWSITQAALDEMLLASDEEAIGGELAYRYGMNGGIDALGSTTFTILNDSRFAVSNQPLKPESL